ncbi:MAG TPA: hypothetical protein VGH28_11335 [Polyangiaceae bacterium]|jgi:hypothetical protein
MEKTTVSGRKLVLVGGSVSIVVLFGVTFAFRTFGWTRFVANSQLQEGKSNVIYLARAVATCAQQNGKLPPTSHTVPYDLSQVGGKTYTSTDADWADEAFSCSGFRVRDAQRFQYQWERTSDHGGVARARADFNGDGVVEATYEQELECVTKDGKLRCNPGPFHDRNQ